MNGYPPTIAKVKAFIADDSQVIITLLTSILYDLGCKQVTAVDSFESAQKHLSSIDGPAYDIVFLDRYLPSDNGLDLIDVVRKKDRRLPIIMLTVENHADKVIEAITRGATDYIVKPFNHEMIQAKLEKALKISL